MRKRSVFPGLITLAISAVLFYFMFADILAAGLSGFMFYFTVLFTSISLLSGISVGRKIAYAMHDRKLVADKLGGTGHISGFFGKGFDISLWAGTIFIVGWTVFMVLMGYLFRAVADSILLGYVRWLSIISMTALITGSYLLFRARSSGREKMLSFWGKRARMPVNAIEETEREIDDAEAHMLSMFGYSK